VTNWKKREEPITLWLTVLDTWLGGHS